MGTDGKFSHVSLRPKSKITFRLSLSFVPKFPKITFRLSLSFPSVPKFPAPAAPGTTTRNEHGPELYPVRAEKTKTPTGEKHAADTLPRGAHGCRCLNRKSLQNALDTAEFVRHVPKVSFPVSRRTLPISYLLEQHQPHRKQHLLPFPTCAAKVTCHYAHIKVQDTK
jgi:hypothetical protein